MTNFAKPYLTMLKQKLFEALPFLYTVLSREIKLGKKSTLKSFTKDSSQQTFTCSKSTIETLQKALKYVQVNSSDTRITSMISHDKDIKIYR